jgi:hypothetical protein
MSTTFVEERRLVLRSAARPHYGVEVSAAADSERIQCAQSLWKSLGAGPIPRVTATPRRSGMATSRSYKRILLHGERLEN